MGWRRVVSAAMPLHVAGFTNLSRDHLDFHGDMTSYYDAKASLFHDYLPEGAAGSDCDP